MRNKTPCGANSHFGGSNFMKRLVTLVLAAGLVLSAASGAQAIEFKASGQWLMGFNAADGNLVNKMRDNGKKTRADNEDIFSAGQLETITEFSQHMNFFGIDLTRVPEYSLSAENLPLLVFPILALITSFISTWYSMNSSGQKLQGSMKTMMYVMPLMYIFFCFTVPTAFSLYYVISNVVMMIQSAVLKKIYDPEKVKAEVAAEIEAKRKEQRRGVKSTTIKVVDEKTGKTVEKNISASEMNKRRLEYARMLDEEKYKDERTVPLSELGQNKED